MTTSPEGNASDHDRDEQRPLLDDGSATEDAARLAHLCRKVLVLSFILIVLLEIGAYLAATPLTSILEAIVCRNIHPELANVVLSSNGGIEDERCKDRNVQSELAMLRGWYMTFNYVPGIIVAIPYGFIADKPEYGRKVVFCLAYVGIILNVASYIAILYWSNIFPVRLTWLCSVFYFVGGGLAVFNSTIFTIVSDIVSEKQRSTTFFYLASSVLVGELAASALGSILMQYNPWIPVLLGLGIIIMGFGVALLLPETLGARGGTKDVPPDLVSHGDEFPFESGLVHWFHQLRAKASRLATAALKFVWGNSHLVMLLFTFALTTLGGYSSEMLLQYVTKRYHWLWSRAGFLLSIRAFSSLVLLVAILPGASYILANKMSVNARLKDLWLARASCLLCVVGTLAIGLSEYPVFMIIGCAIWSFGSGYRLLVRSILTSIVEQHHIGILNNTMAMLETVGSLIGGPLLSVTFRAGLDMGGNWIGLPFIGTGMMYLTAAIVVCSVRFPSEARDGDASAEEPTVNEDV